MERRDFLLGSLVGIGAGAGVSEVSRSLRDEADAANAAASASDTDAEPPHHEASLPNDPSIPPDVGPLDPDGRLLSYAQQGEDLILRNVLSSLGIDKPSYLDVGAYHPVVSSNTYLLYAIGGRGVLVEPNPFMAELSRRLRPEDTMLNVGVGVDDTRQADYYVIRGRPQLNTFSKEQVDRYVAQGGAQMLEKTVSMPLVPINEILGEHFDGAPDLLSLDVEGLDHQILTSMDFERFRPAVICVETLVYGTKEIVGDVVDLLRQRRYAVRGGTFVNTVFVDQARLGQGRITL